MEQEQNKPLSELLNLTGKTAVVTGGAQGLGYAVSARLLEAGARVVILDFDSAKGREAVRNLGEKSSFVECDITDEARVKNSFADIGRTDILVNNAGIYPRKAFTEMTGDDFRRVIEVNLTGTFLCSRYAIESMIEREWVAVTSTSAPSKDSHPSSTAVCYDARRRGLSC
jgi:NAD(P)-dependent dehydrogenase (short-subunit alcohol dehydrogenase family)